MNGSDGYIYIDRNVVSQAVDDFLAQAGAVHRIISQMESQLQPLIDSWVGEDKDAYYVVQSKWNEALNRIGQLLQQNSALLDTIREDYDFTARSGQQRWESVPVGSR